MTGYSDKYKIRVGDYRIAMTVDKKTQTIIYQRVAHRRDIYRTFP
ncbi:type II toxin-antitoxin system RelE/ParE family toxin [Oscillatoria sp. HE19RPO]